MDLHGNHLNDRIWNAMITRKEHHNDNGNNLMTENDDSDEQVEEMEITEAEMLALLDQQEDALIVCQRLLRENSEPIVFNVLSKEDAQNISEKGWLVKDAVIPAERIEAAALQAKSLYSNGVMQLASTIHSDIADPFRDGNARGDFLCWYMNSRNLN
jgi:hypothetical protein